MDQNLLLTAERLSLNPDLQRGWVSRDAFVVKNVSAQTYLSVSNDQWEVLRAFAQPSTVPEVFTRLLTERICPPLREFYELVLKAYGEGVLVSAQSRKPARKAIRWPGVRMDFMLWPLGLLMMVLVVWIAWRVPLFTDAMLPNVAGTAVALLALSLGQMLAAAVLAGAGGEVYLGRPVSSLARLHVRFDLRDARLLRPAEQALMALASSLPLSLALVATLVKFNGLAAPVAMVWLLTWRPWGAGLARRLAHLLSRCPQLDTDAHFVFGPNQRPQLHWRGWWLRCDWRVCLLELAWAAAWSLLVARVILDGLGLSFAEVAGDWALWSIALPALGAALLVTILVIMVRRWRDGLRRARRAIVQRFGRVWRHWRREYVFPDNEAALLRMTAAHPLLGLLNPYDQTLIVRAWRPVNYKAWSRLAEFGKESHHVGVILSGRAAAYRIGNHGRRVRALSLEEGGFFALPAIRTGDENLLEVRSRTPVAAMMMPTDVFRQVLIGKLGAETVYDLTHKYAFLQQLPLCASWHAHAVGRFARIAQIAAYADGEVILREQEDTRWFYIVYDGIAQVRRGGKLLSRLKTGDFFGEMSLLQNSGATADVVAQGNVRCLQIDRTSFLRFMTHNHHVALQLERISSVRLGRPIFPLSAYSFDGTTR